MTQSNNILLDHSITHDYLNISVSRKSLETPMNTNDLSSLTAKTKRKTSINSIENYINNKYDKIALSHLKQSILSEVHATINEKIISIPKTDEVTYLQNHIDTLMSELYFLHEELKEKNNLIKILLNKTEVIKHVTIRNNKTLKGDQPSPTNNNLKLVVNDTSNACNPTNESYHNNSTENITSSNHCAGLQIGDDEYDSVETDLYDSTSDCQCCHQIVSYHSNQIKKILIIMKTGIIILILIER